MHREFKIIFFWRRRGGEAKIKSRDLYNMSFITLSSPQQELFFSDLFSAFAQNIQLEIYGT